jgi:alkylation response protein AidB-like acyl-CoA dehydrogenase
MTNDEIEIYLQESVCPQAAIADKEPEVLQAALRVMGENSWLALQVSPELGGAGMNSTDYHRFQVLVARYSGALAFLQTQHQSAAALLAASDNQLLQQEYFPGMARGKRLVGLGFSQLRRREPIMKAVPVTDGYALTGTVPWITGYGIFDDFIIGATLPDGRELYGVLPLQNQQQDEGGRLELSSPLELIAMRSINTVTAKLDNYWLNSERKVAIQQRGAIARRSQKNVLHHGFFALGCAYAGLDLVAASHNKPESTVVTEFWQSLDREVSQCDQAMFAAISDDLVNYEQKLPLRAKSIQLAVRCAHAAVIVSGGTASLQDSTAGRIYREALLFSVFGQTLDVMKASLVRLRN